jgi:DNA-binding NarL/FixJ family response regulator
MMKNSAGAQTVRVVLADDHDLVRSGIKALLGMVEGVEVVAEARNGEELVKLVEDVNDTVDFVKRAVSNGACGYLMKDAPPFELEQALRSVMATGSYFSPSIAQRLLQPSEPTVDDELTHRQVEILKLIAQGKASKEIAYELGLSPKTVDVHRARIMERLRLNDIASLTLYAVRKGLVKP